MAFRSRRLEMIFGARFEELTYESLKAVEGSSAAVESDDLDWKIEYSSEKKDRNAEIAKDVAAFANASGGLIVVGMAEDKATSAASKIKNQPITDRVEREFHQAVAANVFPPPRYSIRRLPDPDGNGSVGVLVVGIPSSPLAPHAIISAERPDYAYPRRRGNKIDWLREPEIATAYRQRFAEAASRQDRLDEVEFDNLEVFFEAGHREPLLTVSMVPEIPGEFRIDRQSVEELEASVLGGPPIGPNVQRTLRIITVGSKRLQATDSRSGPKIHCDFHSDGSGSWGVLPRVHHFAEEEDEETGYAQTHYIVTQIVNALMILGQHAERSGVTGTAAVRVSLWASVYDHPSLMAHATPGLGRLPYDYYKLHLGKFEGGQRFRVQSSRPAQHAQADCVCILDTMTKPSTELMQSAAFVAGRLLQAFGLIESDQIREDGKVRSYAFPHEDERYWLEWCGTNGIPITRSGD